jgi:hypothetical protein
MTTALRIFGEAVDAVASHPLQAIADAAAGGALTGVEASG